MAAISAAQVKELRLKTDAPMMECKKALTEADGDMAKAEEILRVKLGNKATKAASRVTAEGVVVVYASDDKKLGAILEVNSETDFVAKTLNFADRQVNWELSKQRIEPYTEAEEIKCSFCGKSSNEVEKMIVTSDDVCICNECVGLCSEVLQEEIDKK